MDIILLIIASFYISKRAKQKGEDSKKWVLQLIGICIVFEISGTLLSMAITGGDLYMALIFGFVCAVGGFLLIKYRLDKIVPKKQDTDPDRHDRMSGE